MLKTNAPRSCHPVRRVFLDDFEDRIIDGIPLAEHLLAAPAKSLVRSRLRQIAPLHIIERAAILTLVLAVWIRSRHGPNISCLSRFSEAHLARPLTDPRSQSGPLGSVRRGGLARLDEARRTPLPSTRRNAGRSPRCRSPWQPAGEHMEASRNTGEPPAEHANGHMQTCYQGAILLAVPKREPAAPGARIGAAGLRALGLRAPR